MSVTVDHGGARCAALQGEAKARRLARWCYEQGVPAVVDAPDTVRRAAARRAGVCPPRTGPDGVSRTWAVVGELLAARADWDAAHGWPTPAVASCVGCAGVRPLGWWK